jgi:hypothetical protein
MDFKVEWGYLMVSVIYYLCVICLTQAIYRRGLYIGLRTWLNCFSISYFVMILVFFFVQLFLKNCFPRLEDFCILIALQGCYLLLLIFIPIWAYSLLKLLMRE